MSVEATNYRIVHIIDSLEAGGAESLLINTINLLSSYHHLIITLRSKNHFQEQCQNLTNLEVVSLNQKSTRMTLKSIVRCRKLIKKFNPSIVHAHLFWSTIVGRFSCFNLDIRFFFTIHTLMSKDVFRNRLYRIIERWTKHKKHQLIGVSNTVIADYKRVLQINPSSQLLYNYVPGKFFKDKAYPVNSGTIRSFLSVGNFKPVKNFDLLYKAFESLGDPSIKLDIYGGGYSENFSNSLSKGSSDIRLMGFTQDISGSYDKYDAFIMASLYEGFGLVVVEAMASRLPLFLSDISTFHEITDGNAVFFDPQDHVDLANQITMFKNGQFDTKTMVAKNFERARELFSEETYTNNLLHIYQSI